MGDRVFCRECEAIAEELAQAYADAWASSDPETKTAWIAVQRMIGGTEQDVERAEELARKFELREPSLAKIEDAYFPGPFGKVLQRKFAHEAHTRHRISFPPE